MTKETVFYKALTKTLMDNLVNFHGADNWGITRFGKRRFGRQAFVEGVLLRLNRFLRRHGYCVTPADQSFSTFDSMVTSCGQGLSETYSMLADEYSRSALTEVLAYRLLGYRHVKLWTNTADYWKARALAGSLPTEGHNISAGTNIRHLCKTDLNPIGYPITIFTHPVDITHQFILKHYVYERSNPPLRLSDGDYVIDAGASWGYTALRFAHEVGEKGRIFCFEFEPKSLEILKKNLELNPRLASLITVVEKALWNDSSTILDFIPRGPGTRVSKGPNGEQENQVSSVSIDSFAETLPRVDFIKMDIEGAELPALYGAAQTIRKHRPKLAISLYHNLSDFVDIPEYLASLGVDYSYYLDHVTIHSEETTLFAVPSTQQDRCM
jgi:FkbM family methyltransferase